jgi:REP element-mobilizing transposase RayT
MCTLRRTPAFANDLVVSTARRQFLQCADELQFAVFAYVFMPDHLHGLVEGSSATSDFQGFCYRLRRRTSSACRPIIREGLWQNGYHERVLRGPRGTEAIVAYIVNNPVRAGLTVRAEDYPYSWSIDHR